MNAPRLALFLCLGTLPAAAQGPTFQINRDTRTLSISATDNAETDPDIADLHIGFVVYGNTLKSAYKVASDNSNAIVKAMLAAGAPQNEIQSRHQRISRLSDWEIREQKGNRYSIHQSWLVSVAPKDAALVLDAAVEAGANESGQITWRLQDTLSLETEAIRRATARAKAMATELATGMGAKLGKPMFATNTMQVIFYSAPEQYEMDANMAGVAMKRAAPAAPPPLVIEAERVGRTATVQIVYAIE